MNQSFRDVCLHFVVLYFIMTIKELNSIPSNSSNILGWSNTTAVPCLAWERHVYIMPWFTGVTPEKHLFQAKNDPHCELWPSSLQMDWLICRTQLAAPADSHRLNSWDRLYRPAVWWPLEVFWEEGGRCLTLTRTSRVLLGRETAAANTCKQWNPQRGRSNGSSSIATGEEQQH